MGGGVARLVWEERQGEQEEEVFCRINLSYVSILKLFLISYENRTCFLFIII